MENILYFSERGPWRKWLEGHFENQKEAWLIYPHKDSERPCILYNDAVEEALCFGWIDSIIKKHDDSSRVQRFSPRRARSQYSQPNRERLAWLRDHDLIHSSVMGRVEPILAEEFTFAADILDALRQEPSVWAFYQACTPSYQRIRVAWIEAARTRPEVFQQRLESFLKRCRQQKLVPGYGGVQKYY